MATRTVFMPEGDAVVPRDTGASYFSAPWAYNSLPTMGVHGFLYRDGGVGSAPVRTPQTLGEAVDESGASHATALTTGFRS
ncbi:hypothetical protein ACH4TP_39855 [Streptomyces sp. NPDC021012]|uniref:hypothetical protein n=1 Tax=Streptomyces sp. NPDC021012 TaxID=3365107 RepID=UPI0037987ECD